MKKTRGIEAWQTSSRNTGTRAFIIPFLSVYLKRQDSKKPTEYSFTGKLETQEFFIGQKFNVN